MLCGLLYMCTIDFAKGKEIIPLPLWATCNSKCGKALLGRLNCSAMYLMISSHVEEGVTLICLEHASLTHTCTTDFCIYNLSAGQVLYNELRAVGSISEGEAGGKGEMCKAIY